jgi:putative salt-induced outer membrane protein YdiY
MFDDRARVMPPRLTVLLFMACAAVPGAARAQSSADAEPPPKVEASADLSFVKTGGNSTTESLGLSGSMTYRPGPLVIELRGQGIRSRSDDVLNAESVSFTTRGSRQIHPKIAVFGQHDYLHDPFTGLGDEHFLTAGVAVTFFDDDEQTLKVDVSAGRNNQAGPRSKPGAGGILGVSYRWAFGVSSDLTQDTRWLVSFSQADARRLESNTALTVGMTSVLSLRLSFALRRQQTPRPQFRQTDTTTSTAIVFSY